MKNYRDVIKIDTKTPEMNRSRQATEVEKKLREKILSGNKVTSS